MFEKKIYNINYKNRGVSDVVKTDLFSLSPNQFLIISFLSVNSQNSQGIRLSVDRDALLIHDDEKKRSFWFWEEKCGKNLIVIKTNKRTNVCMFNVCCTPPTCYHPQGEVLCQMDYSGMIIKEKKANHHIYRCNDLYYSTSFDSLIFETVIIDSDSFELD